MVFVWSYLTDGDPAYTLVQVSLNDLIMLVLFAPIVRFLVSGASSLGVPFVVLLYSVAIFIVIPLAAGVALRAWLTRARGKAWFEQEFLPKFSPVTILALLATLIFIFAFQAENITGRYFHVVLIAVPIIIQVYFNSTLAYGLMSSEGRILGGGARRADRRQQLLRAGGRYRYRIVWSWIGRGAGDRGWGAGRSASDALGVQGVQPHTALDSRQQNGSPSNKCVNQPAPEIVTGPRESLETKPSSTALSA